MNPDSPLRLDLRGLKCPLPVLRARKALRSLPPSSRVIVESDDPMSGVDIPNFCREEGHRLIDSRFDSPVFRFEIERGGG